MVVCNKISRLFPVVVISCMLAAVVGCSTSRKITSSESLQTYTFEAADSLMQIRKRPFVVFLHTDWCKYCENMKQTTFRDEDVIHLLNEQFYFISFDGENTQPVRFRDHLFVFNATAKGSGNHELASELGTIEGKLTYPTLVILNTDYEITFQHSGYLTPREMHIILTNAIQ